MSPPDSTGGASPQPPSVPGEPGGPKERVRRAGEVATHLRRVLRGHRTYASDHEILVSQRADLLERLEALLELEERVALEITAHTIAFEGKTLIEAEAKETAISLPLFLDGVQRLTLHSGIDAAQLERLLQLWWEALEGKNAAEQNFVTRFWEGDFQHVSVLAVETFVQGEESEGAVEKASERQQQHVQAVVAELAGERLAGGARGEGAKVQLMRVSREDLAVLKMDEVAGIDGDLLERFDDAALGALSGPSDDETAALRDEASTLPNHAVARALCALIDALDPDDVGSVEQVRRLAATTFSSLAASGMFGSITASVGRAMRFARSDPQQIARRCQALVFVLEGLDRQEVVEPLIQALDDPEQQAAAVAALGVLTPHAAPLLLASLSTLHTPEAMAHLREILLRMRPGAEILHAGFAEAGVGEALFLLELAAAMGDDRQTQVLAPALAHPGARVRRRAVEQLAARGSEKEELALLRPLLLDPEPDIRRLSLDALMRGAVSGLPSSLRTLLGREALEDDERHRLIVALGRIQGREASLVLQRELKACDDPELKIACVRALGRCRDLSALPALEAAARGLFTSRQIKEAVEEAIHRLKAGRP